ncbi:hypothetical protein SS50377_22014 [Spironucleus salmonicida]|uniref:Uncharacterized protein n=1 Tax=Spironucleus salmonicida TaxID=348837 RepID=V6LQ29_9EUKA|nr:hypothetical protein SS50377_22014 [Spironucleus salmonicida]|eukprot:EST45821.1 Hypothetical protein SS50377_14396 [Spironucleus salmonicida]
MEPKTLHSVFDNPDPDILFPVAFPQFLPSTAITADQMLSEWIQTQLIQNCVHYKIRTQFTSKSGQRQAILQCRNKTCGHQVVCRLESNGWKLVCATSHSGHFPGALADLKQLKMSAMTRGRIEELCKQQFTNIQIRKILITTVGDKLKGEQLEYMMAHRGLIPACKTIENVRRAMLKQLSVGNQRAWPDYDL